jgi:WD40 repeat protein/tRNA A-37 threonylcarbamoyl transferase component Bud32
MPGNKEESKSFGRYQIVRELGHGGMGVVYHAYDASLKRHVALKIMHQLMSNDKEQKRFARETQLMARLNHPHIIRVFDTGEEQGRMFFTMEMVEGNSLATLLKENTPLTQLLLMLVQVAEAVYYAHQQGVVHRDLKPSNIMVTTQGEPKVMDFGLAKETSRSGDQLSKSHDILGTPEYMSPEQASGKGRAVDTQSDVYSLGAILYEMLTGRPPFTGPTAMSVLYKISCEEPIPPLRLSPHLPPDLEAICLKSLEKSKDKRYKTAHDLASDLNNYREGRPIMAKPVTALTRAWKLARRYRMASLLIAGAILLLLGFVVFFVYQQKKLKDAAEQNWRLAEKKQQEAEQNWRQAERQKATALLREIKANLSQAKAELILAKTWLNEKDYFSAEERQDAAYGLLQKVSSSIKENKNKWDKENPQELAKLGTQQQALEQAALDMRRYVIVYFKPHHEVVQLPVAPLIPSQPSFDYAALLGEGGQKAVIWDIQQQKSIKILNIVPAFLGVAFSTNNQWVALSCANRLLLWNRADDSVQETHINPNELCWIAFLRFSPDNKWLFVAISILKGDKNFLFDLTNFSAPLKIHDLGNSYAAAFSRNGEWLLVAQRDHSLATFDLRQNREKLVEPVHNTILPAGNFCFGPKDAYLISGYMNDLFVRPLSKDMKNSHKEDSLTLLAVHRGKLMELALSRDEQFLFSAGKDGRLVCWNTFQYTKIWESAWPGHLRGAATLIAHPEKKQVMVWTNGSAHRYTWKTPIYKKIDFLQRPETRKMAAVFQGMQRMHIIKNMASVMACLAFSANNQYLAFYAHPDLYLWHLADDTLQQLNMPGNLATDPGTERQLAFDDKDECLFFARQGSARLFQTSNGKLKLPIETLPKQMFWPRPRGGFVSSREGQSQPMIGVWRTVGERLMMEKEFAVPHHRAIAMHPSGKQLAFMESFQPILNIWDIEAARLLISLRLDRLEASNFCTAITFISDTRLALGYDNGDLMVYDLQERQDDKKIKIIASFFAPVRRIWHQPSAHLYWVHTNNGLYIYPDTEDETQRESLNQIYPLQLFAGYSVVTCEISKNFRYLAVLMQSGELLVVPLPEVK